MYYCLVKALVLLRFRQVVLIFVNTNNNSKIFVYPLVTRALHLYVWLASCRFAICFIKLSTSYF